MDSCIFLDEFANKRVAHTLERCGSDRLHRRAGIHFARDVQPVRTGRTVVMSGSRISIYFPTSDGHLDGMRPELRQVSKV